MKYFREKLCVSGESIRELEKADLEYNIKAAFLLGVLYAVLAMAEILICVGQFLVVPYIILFILFASTLFILKLIKEKEYTHKHLLFNCIFITQTCILLVFFQLISHMDILKTGIRNTNIIILFMLCIASVMRLKLKIMLILEWLIVFCTVILLIYERDIITNFFPGLVGILTSGILMSVISYVQWRSRFNNFIISANLNKLVTSDALTNVLNRRGFDAILSHTWNESIKENFPLTLYVVDIDHFKNYNDSYGHVKGDECLLAVANALSRSVRDNDFVARYGGEEFVVMMTRTGANAAKIAAERILENIRSCNIPHESSVEPYVTVSIGCMTCRPAKAEINIQTFLTMADDALYMAKQQGRNRLVVHPESDYE